MSDLSAEEHFHEANRLLAEAWSPEVRQDGPYAMFCLQTAMVHSSMACALLFGMTTPGVSLGKDVPVR